MRLPAAPPADAVTPAAVPQPYPFFPQAGTLWQDLTVNNFVDLGTGTAPLDFECGERSYLGHNGHDAVILGFREQALGVPVFAALDGIVTAAHDGEDDMNTQALGQPSNHVVLDHGGGHETRYLHLRKFSVAVSPGQSVVAGTQLGLTASSGHSTWPHLHFESRLNGVRYEPNAGPCRPGTSHWVNQTPVRHGTYLKSFTFATVPFSGNAQYPWDQVTPVGTFLTGLSRRYFRFAIHDLPAQSTARFVLRRPDGTTQHDWVDPFDNPTAYRSAWYWFAYDLSFAMTGQWSLTVYINNTIVGGAPFTVVASPGSVVNRPPLPMAAVTLDPAQPTVTDVPFCRVTPFELYRRDPDYDIVRYRYQWSRNGTTIRDVTSAALSDALPRGSRQPGDSLTCTVTPLDETLAGPPASATTSAPVTILSHPQSRTAEPGEEATLSVAATGSGPLNYQWYLGETGVTSSPIAGALASSFTTPPLIGNTRYWVRVSAPAGSADSSTALISVSFSDPTLVPGSTTVRARHITELRARVERLRARYGLNPFAYEDPVLAAGMSIKATHIVDLRAAITDVFAAAQLTPPQWLSPPVPRFSPVRATHMIELRNAVLAVE